MDAERRAHAKVIFLDALDRPEDERAAFVHGACGDDAALRHAVESLLEAHRRADRFLAQSAAVADAPEPRAGDLPHSVDLEEHDRPGSMIGRYRLVERIGEGGFGTVHRAEQTAPVRRTVALKLLRAGMDSRDVIARFEAERHTLALMNHPNIATVLDAGTTERGRPYVVMEFVPGAPITTDCDRERLDTAERLRLFLDVCAAVQHAHQKGIIHRDLKPSNVLVTRRDGDALAKVIDFGIAKATDPRLDDRPFRTEIRQLVGTPEYMSPEQAEPNIDIDTRSDIYALGVLLYELLTGTTPFDPARLRSASFGEIQRIIRDEEPPRPSTRIGALRDRRDDVARHRGTDPAGLVRRVRGDLDWIVMRCLEKDRSRRYPTAQDLASDIRRHLAGEPVLACPPSVRYLIAKFAQRHRVAITVALLFVAVLVGAGAVGWGLFVDARRARAIADAQATTAVATREIATSALWASLLGEARAVRQTTLHDRRREALRLVSEAAQIRVNADVRSEAIAALTLPGIEIVRSWRAFEPPWAAVDFDGSNALWAIADDDGQIAIRRVEDGSVIGVVPSIGLRATFISLDADGRFLLAKYESPTASPPVRLATWDLRTMTRTIDVGSDLSPGLPTFDHSGELVGMLVEPTRIRVLRVEDGAPVAEIVTGDRMHRLRFDPSSTRIAASVSHEGPDGSTTWSVVIHELPAGDSSATAAPSRSPMRTHPVPAIVRDIAWTADGRWIAFACGDFRIHLFATDDDRAWPRSFVGHQAEVVDVRFSRDGTHLLSSSWDNTTRLWHTESGRELSSIAGFLIAKTYFDDAPLTAFRRRDGSVGLWRVDRPDRLVASWPAHVAVKGPNHGDVSADGSMLVTSAGDGLGFWDPADGTPLGFAQVGGAQQTYFDGTDARSVVTIAMGGLRRWTIDHDASGVRLGAAESIIADSTIGHHVRWMARSRHGEVVAVSGRDVPLTILDIRSGSRRTPLRGRAIEGRFALHPTAALVAWNDPREGIMIAELADGSIVATLESSPATELAFSPCGEFLVANGNEVVIRRCEDWSEVGRHPGSHDQLPMRSLAISPDGAIVAAVIEMERVLLLDLPTAMPIASLHAPTPAHLNWLTFLPDGDTLLAIGWHQVQRWDLGELRRELRMLGLDWK